MCHQYQVEPCKWSPSLNYEKLYTYSLPPFQVPMSMRRGKKNLAASRKVLMGIHGCIDCLSFSSSKRNRPNLEILADPSPVYINSYAVDARYRLSHAQKRRKQQRGNISLYQLSKHVVFLGQYLAETNKQTTHNI